MPEYIATSPDGRTRNRVSLPDNYDMSKVPPGVTLEPVQGAVGKIPSPDMGFMESAKEGFMDPYVGVEQMHRHASGGDAASYDEYVRAREENLRQRGVQVGSRFVGGMANPLNLMTAAATEGGSLAAGPALRVGLGAAGGAAGAAMEPVTGGDFGIEKGAQVAGGAVTGGALGRLGTEGTRTRPPLRETVGTVRTNLYDTVARSGSELNRPMVANLADTILNNLQSRPPFFRERFAPETFDAIRELRDMPWLQPGMHPTVADVDQAQQVLKHALMSPDSRERAAATVAQDMLSNWLDNIPPGAIRSGNPRRDAATLSEAQRLHRVDKRVEAIETAERQARTRTGSTGIGGNINNVTRQEARKLAQGKEGRRWSDEEQEALEAIAEGSFTNNTLRFIGKWAPSGPVSSIGAIGTWAAGHPDLAATLAVAGFAAKHAGDVGTTRALRAQASRLLRSSGLPDEPTPAYMRPFIAAPAFSPAAGQLSADAVDALAPYVDDALR